jgi:UDP-2,3-diacylglucosamine pyrophosphatase LpxH
MNKLKYRSIFISDVHLGSKNCKAEYLLDFLRSTESEYLYLVGDIFDLWEMRKTVCWTAAQSEILETVFIKARNGTRVFYIPGNHDEWFRRFAGSEIHGVMLKLKAEHIAADGRRFLVSHGDEFDSVVRHNPVLLFVGDHAYNLLLKLDRGLNRLRRLLGRSYWSLSAWLKTRVNNANDYIRKFETAAAVRAGEKSYDGYICGHIHKAGIRSIDGVLYCNDGDWVEHCTALAEDDNGWIHLLHWSDQARVEAVSRGHQVEAEVVPLNLAREVIAADPGPGRRKAA